MSQSFAQECPDLAAWWDRDRNYPITPEDVTRGSDRRAWFTDPDDPDYTEFVRIKAFTRRKHPRKYLTSVSGNPMRSTQEISGFPGSDGEDESGRRTHDPDGMLGVSNTAPDIEPKIHFEADGKNSGVLDISGLTTPTPDENELFTKFLIDRGIDPEEYRIADTLRISEWEQARKVVGEDGNITYDKVKLYAYKYRLLPRHTFAADMDSLIEAAKNGALQASEAQSIPLADVGNVVRTWQVSDLQIGKVENGGLTQEGLIKRYFEGLEEFRKTIRPGQPVHTIFAGDCLEGNQSQGGKNVGYRTPLGMEEQQRMYSRILMETIIILAACTPDLTVSVVGGNHDDIDRRTGNKAGSNWATGTAIVLNDALRAFSDEYSHVRILVPQEDKSWMTVEVAGSVWTIAHGHQWRRGKAAEWWKSLCYYSDNAAAAHILAHGHEHTFNFRQEGGRSIICSPTMDGGSDWFAQSTGAWQEPHGVAYDAVEGQVLNLTFI